MPKAVALLKENVTHNFEVQYLEETMRNQSFVVMVLIGGDLFANAAGLARGTTVLEERL